MVTGEGGGKARPWARGGCASEAGQAPGCHETARAPLVRVHLGRSAELSQGAPGAALPESDSPRGGGARDTWHWACPPPTLGEQLQGLRTRDPSWQPLLWESLKNPKRSLSLPCTVTIPYTCVAPTRQTKRPRRSLRQLSVASRSPGLCVRPTSGVRKTPPPALKAGAAREHCPYGAACVWPRLPPQSGTSVDLAGSSSEPHNCTGGSPPPSRGSHRPAGK